MTIWAPAAMSSAPCCALPSWSMRAMSRISHLAKSDLAASYTAGPLRDSAGLRGNFPADSIRLARVLARSVAGRMDAR